MKYLPLIFFSFLVQLISAQTPNGLNYQAAIRDAQGNPLVNQVVSIRFSILNSSPTGSVAYAENHNNVSTNGFGLVNLVIGQGVVAQGSFTAIDWANGHKFLKVEVDNMLLGTTQLLSVPYALYAEKTNIQAGNGISINGTTISNAGDNDNSPTNELQTISLISNNVLQLSNNGGTVTLPANTTAIQQGNGIEVNQTGNVFTITNTGDLNSTNELQSLSLTGNVLKLVPNGGEVTLQTSSGGNPVAPGFTTTQILNMSNPAAGTIVLNTDDKGLYYYSGMNWYKLNGTLLNQPGTFVLNGPNDCLKAYYTFDDDTGADVVGNYDANNNGCTFSSNVNSKINSGKSAVFNNVSFMSVANGNPMENFTQGTISFWIKSTDGDACILNGGSDVNSSVFKLQILANSGSNYLWYNTSNQFYMALNPMVPYVLDNSWHHVAVTIQPFKHVLYIDAVVVETVTNFSYGMTGTNNNSGMLIGKRGGSSAFNFTGLLDNLRIHCKALTAAEVFEIYNAGQ